ncbi:MULTISPECIES: hypothetical protein [unclassified Burkholderia]|uniref:hypothetical protein n=1 Tax=unclassified Burkholderia TaxID=2613784 RepID=UPI00197F247F|nr:MULTISPECIES: hypothetical protein [unclassified Burkholderia]MBN3770766.1 hypothetical protein [Burkholderia sp. Se-20378]MBN3796419.1 hypothetical protein [Burkholderia sp. Ac-20392]
MRHPRDHRGWRDEPARVVMYWAAAGDLPLPWWFDSLNHRPPSPFPARFFAASGERHIFGCQHNDKNKTVRVYTAFRFRPSAISSDLLAGKCDSMRVNAG